MSELFVFGLAGESPLVGITTAFSTGISTMVADTFTMLAAIVPIVLPLMGAAIAIAYCVKFIKKLSHS